MAEDNCVLCGDPLPKDHPGRNNAQPLKDGECCDKCNWSKVIPKRMRLDSLDEEGDTNAINN